MLLLKIVEKLLDKHARLINISNIQRLNLKLNLGLHLAGLTNSIKIKIKLYKSICKEKDNHKKEIYERQFKTYHNLISKLLGRQKNLVTNNNLETKNLKLATHHKGDHEHEKQIQ